MRNSTIKNLNSRAKWLDAVAARTVSLNSAQMRSLQTMQDFCKLSVKDVFVAISYNSLKDAARSQKQDSRSMLSTENGWDNLKLKLVQARLAVVPEPTPAPKDSLPNDDEILAQTLLEAHFCSMAYVELYNFLLSLSTENSTAISERARLKIEHQLSISTAKFKEIISASNRLKPDQLTLRSVHKEDV
jgi:hypothetical protein